MMESARDHILKLLEETTGEKDLQIEVPPTAYLGDFAFPSFQLAKDKKKRPADIAEELSKLILPDEVIESVSSNGPYVNFFLQRTTVMRRTIKEILEKKESFASKKKTRHALVEHTSINPNASPHVGRARNALIGDAIVRMLRHLGFETEVHYFVNDIGKQIAMLVLAAGQKNPSFDELLELYIKINKDVEENPEKEKLVFELLSQLEADDKEVLQRFRKVVKTCIDGQARILGDLGITYDTYDYESDLLFDGNTKEIIAKLEKTGKLFTDEEYRQVLNQEGYQLAMKAPVLVLTRNDGTSLYPLRDIAYNIKKAALAKDRNIIILGEDQKLYQQQINAALSLIGINEPEVVHYSFVLLKEGKMSTRKGNVVLLADLMKEVEENAMKEIVEKQKAKPSKQLARMIGYGALKYGILKISPEKNVTFDTETALSFEGETGPYIQYAHARICSILEKAASQDEGDCSLLTNDKEWALIKMLGNFPHTIEEAARQMRPHILANYLFELSQRFSEFYQECPVLQVEGPLKNARLQVISATKTVLALGLSLLGIDAPERM